MKNIYIKQCSLIVVLIVLCLTSTSLLHTFYFISLIFLITQLPEKQNHKTYKSVSFRAKNIEKYYLIKYIGFTITHFRDFLIEQFLLKLLIINVYLIKSTFIIII